MADGDTGNTATEQNWFEGFDAETKEYITARGLDKKPVNEALGLTIQAHREATKKLGERATVIDPNDASIWEKLGTPKDAASYVIEGIQDSKMADSLRNAFLQAKVPVENAKAIVSGITNHLTQAAADAEVASKAKITLAQQELAQNWGESAQVNTFIAQRAAQALGLSADFVAQVADSAGYATVMEGLRKIGVSMGEGKLLGVHDGGLAIGNKAMTREDAQRARTDLMADIDFRTRWFKGEKKAVDQLVELDKIIVGPAPVR